jgi:hypothetical protein
MAPLPHDQDITSWPQLLTAIENAEAGPGTARLTEICLSVYSALAAAQFQITQLKARVHVLATSRPCPRTDPMTVAGSRLPPPASTVSSQGEHTMGLPAGEQRVLDMIENELRITDQRLAAAFAAFTRFASGTRMPRPERLTAWPRLITRRHRWRVGLLRPSGSPISPTTAMLPRTCVPAVRAARTSTASLQPSLEPCRSGPRRRRSAAASSQQSRWLSRR